MKKSFSSRVYAASAAHRFYALHTGLHCSLSISADSDNVQLDVFIRNKVFEFPRIPENICDSDFYEVKLFTLEENNYVIRFTF